jgi:predicted metal-dependent HD superfamily phosphohydrolase
MSAEQGPRPGEEALGRAFRALAERLGIAPRAAALWSALRQRYSEPHRAYHTLRHIAECLAHFESARSLAEDADLVEFAVWAHDVVYDPRRDDNERHSAEWARRALLDAGRPSHVADSAYALVVATTHDAIAAGADARLLCDVDLAILGAPRARFEEYEAQIRAEYAWVPEAVFKVRRAEVIERFLARPAIYGTPHFRQTFEDAARSNLDRSLQALRG